MTRDAIDFLERQVEYLRGLNDLEFMFAVEPFLAALDANVYFAAHMSDLEAQLARIPTCPAN